MKSLSITIAMCIFVALLFVGGVANADTNYIYGIHDIGGYGGADFSTVDMTAETVRGYIVHVAEIGYNADDYSFYDFRWLAQNGFTIICRIDNSAQCNGSGTLPYQTYYRSFAQRCANFVANSHGCHIWIIGNEPNTPIEWPGGPSGEKITVARYVECYNLCYDAIKAVPGHAGDIVCPAAVCTWQNSTPGYPAVNPEVALFDDYFDGVLAGIGSTKVNGIVLHAYTRGAPPNDPADPDWIISNDWFSPNPPFNDIYAHFRVYRNYMNRIPTSPTAWRTKPVYITETGEAWESSPGVQGGWIDSNSGWMEALYSEINDWNNTAGYQKIRCVVPYRWGPAGGVSAIYNLLNVRQDWRDAMAYGYTWTSTPTADDAYSGTDAGASVSAALAIMPGTPPVRDNIFDGFSRTFSHMGDYMGAISSSDTDDYYKFYVISGQNITASLRTPSGINCYFYICNPSGISVVYDTSTALNKTLNYRTTSTGWWAIRVYRNSGAGNYTFAVTLNTMIPKTTPTGTNYALTATATASSVYDDNEATYGSAKAKDNTTSTYWMSKSDGSTQWIEYDLGAVRNVDRFCFKFASTAGLSTTYNIKNFRIMTRRRTDLGWHEQCAVDNSKQEATVIWGHPQYEKALRYIRVVVTNPGADNYARIVEFEVWGTTPNLVAGTQPTGGIKVGTGTAGDSYIAPNYPAWVSDGTTAYYWQSANTTDPHWVSKDMGDNDWYPAIAGFIVRHAHTNAALPAIQNTRDFKLQVGDYYGNSVWTDNATVTGNTADITYLKYGSPVQLSAARLYITDPGSDPSDNSARITELETIGVQPNLAWNFESLPFNWTSSQTTGSAATWGLNTGGGYISGNCLQVSRASATGVSTKVIVFTVSPYTSLEILLYCKMPTYSGGMYWVDTAYKLGSNAAQDFYDNPNTWTMINELSDTGTNGTGNVWTCTPMTVYTMKHTQISIGIKHGAYGCTGPTVLFDALTIY